MEFFFNTRDAAEQPPEKNEAVMFPCATTVGKDSEDKLVNNELSK